MNTPWVLDQQLADHAQNTRALFQPRLARFWPLSTVLLLYTVRESDKSAVMRLTFLLGAVAIPSAPRIDYSMSPGSAAWTPSNLSSVLL